MAEEIVTDTESVKPRKPSWLRVKLPVVSFKATETKLELILDMMEWSDY